jgi:hypothetical protein
VQLKRWADEVRSWSYYLPGGFERDSWILSKRIELREVMLRDSMHPEIFPEQTTCSIQSVYQCHSFKRIQEFEKISLPE